MPKAPHQTCSTALAAIEKDTATIRSRMLSLLELDIHTLTPEERAEFATTIQHNKVALDALSTHLEELKQTLKSRKGGTV